MAWRQLAAARVLHNCFVCNRISMPCDPKMQKIIRQTIRRLRLSDTTDCLVLEAVYVNISSQFLLKNYLAPCGILIINILIFVYLYSGERDSVME